MTPKEKAKELVEKMKWEGEMCEDEGFAEFAKECALIAVDETLEAYKRSLNLHPEYWNKVKQEICDL